MIDDRLALIQISSVRLKRIEKALAQFPESHSCRWNATTCALLVPPWTKSLLNSTSKFCSFPLLSEDALITGCQSFGV
jgi:hypothetical protein